jgi:hypothetical protein
VRRRLRGRSSGGRRRLGASKKEKNACADHYRQRAANSDFPSTMAPERNLMAPERNLIGELWS